ncbi:MAG: PfkB family carbohydrate kinase [Candidatus Marinimicrobia bacterium]|nr:PfkB family carbohydrate kinase [Candidatus Neomarinimicrobiota bacterium]
MISLLQPPSTQSNTGEMLIGNSFGMFLGGKGANQAIAASRAGVKVNMVGRLGEDVFVDQLLAK